MSKSHRSLLNESAYWLGILHIFITIGHYIENMRFIPTISGLGSLMSSLCGLVTLSMFSTFSLIIYLFCATLFFGSTGLTLRLGTLSALPYQNVEAIKHNWRHRVGKREYKMILRSWPVVGFAIGPIRPVNRGTIFTILDNISGCTSSLILF